MLNALLMFGTTMTKRVLLPSKVFHESKDTFIINNFELTWNVSPSFQHRNILLKN